MQGEQPPVPARAQRADASRNRDEIVRVARAEFDENGVDVPLERIAHLAGVSRMTLSRHFADRQELALAIFETDIQRLHEVAAKWMEQPDACLQFLRAVGDDCARSLALSEILVQSASGLEKLSDISRRVIAIARPLLLVSQQHGVLRRDLTDDDLSIVIGMLLGGTGKERSEMRAKRGARVLSLLLEGLLERTKLEAANYSHGGSRTEKPE